MVEEELFFNQYAFHPKKIAYHKDTMQAYFQLLVKNGFDVAYIEAHDKRSPVKQTIDSLKKEGVQKIHVYHVHDNWLEKKLIQSSSIHKIDLIWHESPMFMLGEEEMKKEFSGKKTFFQTSFDADNRKPYPKNKIPPALHKPLYPITHAEAEAWLKDFLETRFEEFGLYEDAMVAQEHILHHSVLTPMLNIGLLTPKLVLDRVISFSQAHEIPMNSLEGFVRQVLGWREFIRGIYHVVGNKQRTTNYWRFTRKIPKSFYDGTTGVVPVDNVIQYRIQSPY
jgi:deoxyribodipyrimidine photolyase-related protein